MAHGEQPLSLAYVPAGHSSQALAEDAPTVVVMSPVEHRVHFCCPGLSW